MSGHPSSQTAASTAVPHSTALPFDRLLTADEVCAYLSISRSSLYRYLEEGLPSLQFRQRGARRFKLADVLAYMARESSVTPGTVSGDDLLDHIQSLAG